MSHHPSPFIQQWCEEDNYSSFDVTVPSPGLYKMFHVWRVAHTENKSKHVILCAMPVWLTNNNKSFLTTIPMSVSKSKHMAVSVCAGSLLCGRLTQTQHCDCWHCCRSSRTWLSLTRALWGKSHTTSSLYGFNFKNASLDQTEHIYLYLLLVLITFWKILIEFLQMNWTLCYFFSQSYLDRTFFVWDLGYFANSSH